MHIIFAIVKFLFFQADRSKVEITTVNLEESYNSKIFVEWAPLTFWREWLAFFNATWCSKRVRIFCPSGTYPLFCFPSPPPFLHPPCPLTNPTQELKSFFIWVTRSWLSSHVLQAFYKHGSKCSGGEGFHKIFNEGTDI